MKLLAIFTGGTISCSDRDGVLSPDGSNSYLLLNSRADISFDVAEPYTILSENLGERELTLLGDTVEDSLDKGYDGIIIAHGTDTLQYTAAYLALRLGLCKTPVVLVSAAYPLADSRTNGYINFSAAVDFIASKKGKGVFVSYQNSGCSHAVIHRGGELLAHSAYSAELVGMDGNVYGFVANGRFVPNTEYAEHCPREGCQGRPDGRVLWLKAHPGMVYPKSLDGVSAVLLEGYHSGTLATSSAELKALCQTAAKSKIPVCLTGCDSGFPYESKTLFDELNITVLPKMPPVTAYVKLWMFNKK